MNVLWFHIEVVSALALSENQRQSVEHVQRLPDVYSDPDGECTRYWDDLGSILTRHAADGIVIQLRDYKRIKTS